MQLLEEVVPMTKQIGLGSSVGAISTSITSEGSTERTDNATDLAITGANASL